MNRKLTESEKRLRLQAQDMRNARELRMNAGGSSAVKLLTTEEMLQRLTRSENDAVRILCNKILAKETTIEEELRFCGDFMRAVLKGEYYTALARADRFNRAALLREEEEA